MCYVPSKARGLQFSHLALILWDYAAEELDQLTTVLCLYGVKVKQSSDNCIISCLFSCPHLCNKLNILSGFIMYPLYYHIV